MSKMTHLHVKLPVELDCWLEQYCKEDRWTKSAVLAQALELFRAEREERTGKQSPQQEQAQ